ncbi:CAP domain-containing protein [Kitasatospora sp. NPDC048365]|uniref:CAP domain-containing protein n=1 Tax=Kitasatospora sp. NPDC048365 TaxID=3364050 RepID=UPI003712A04E
MSIDPPAPGPQGRAPAHRAARRIPRLPRAAVAGALVLAAGGAVAAVAALPGPADSTAPAAAAAAQAVTAPPAVPAQAGGTATADPSAPAASVAGTAAASSPPASPSAARPSATRTGAPAAAAPAAKPGGAAAGAASGGDEVQQVLALINSARAGQGLPPYTLTGGLTAAAAGHNAVMSGGCGLSHQCPGEPAVGGRESAQGVHWGAAGENIGRGGPVSTGTADIAAQAVRLTQSMLDEKPPEDGHRRNLLSRSFTHVGIAVYRDSAGTVWLTQDFSD